MTVIGKLAFHAGVPGGRVYAPYCAVENDSSIELCFSLHADRYIKCQCYCKIRG